MKLYRTTGNPLNAYHESGFVVRAEDAPSACAAILDHLRTETYRSYLWDFPEDNEEIIQGFIDAIQVEEIPEDGPPVVAFWENDC